MSPTTSQTCTALDAVVANAYRVHREHRTLVEACAYTGSDSDRWVAVALDHYKQAREVYMTAQCRRELPAQARADLDHAVRMVGHDHMLDLAAAHWRETISS